jgi:hypothetical protein
MDMGASLLLDPVRHGDRRGQHGVGLGIQPGEAMATAVGGGTRDGVGVPVGSVPTPLVGDRVVPTPNAG